MALKAALEERLAERGLVDALTAWACSQPPLAWRAQPAGARDPYVTWIAEIMLQQTTAAVVDKRLPAFLARFPDAAALAAAPEEAVIDAWAGLGYYARARHLHRAARIVAERHGGRLPDQMDELNKLPGIGRYTAAAIAALAFDRPVVGLDTNVARVLLRLAGLHHGVAEAQAATEGHVRLPDGAGVSAGVLVEALMDLGRQICRLGRPRCDDCPLHRFCRAHARGEAAMIPLRRARPRRRILRLAAFVLRDHKGRVLVERRRDGFLKGTWCVPLSAPLGEGAVDAAAIQRDQPAAARWRPLHRPVRHLFTHIELTVYPLVAETADAAPLASRARRWLEPAQAAGRGTALLRKILAALEQA